MIDFRFLCDILPVFVVFEPTVGVEVVDEHGEGDEDEGGGQCGGCLLYTSPSPRD